jgi:4-amino-4-deoxy-L-arabinose transferase-like glycosyltransferase
LIALLAGAAGLLYLWRLGDVPAYLSIEEVSQARAALVFKTQELPPASGARQAPVPAGDYHSSDPTWIYLAPAWVLLASGVLKVLPFSEAAVRLLSASAGVLNVVLIFLVGQELFGRTRSGVIASVLLLVTPAHFIQSRIGTGQIGTVTLTLAWLLFLGRYLNTGRRLDLAVATSCLGFGAYTYAGALVAMPLYFGVTLLVVRLSARADLSRSVIAACAGFGLTFLPLAMWHLVHAEHLIGMAAYYTHGEYNNNMGWTGFFGPAAISHIDAWWACYSPDKLFFSGDSDLRFSTRTAGYLLLPVAVPLIAGLWYAARQLPAAAWALLVSGLIVAPLPGALVSSSEIKRWLTFVPFAILLAAWGVESMLADGRRALKACAIATLLLAGVQSRSFAADYFGRYRDESAVKFGGNLRGAIREALSLSAPHDCVLLDTDVYYLKDYWDLYSRAYGRPELAGAATWFGPADNGQPPTICGAVTVLGVVDDKRFSGWRTTRIAELNGTTSLALYRRDGQ